jgi:hypothetical protein
LRKQSIHECCRETQAERRPGQSIFANRYLHDPSVWIMEPLG